MIKYDLSGVKVLWDNDATLVDSEIIAMPHAINSVFAYFDELGLTNKTNVPVAARDRYVIEWAGKQISQMFEIVAEKYGYIFPEGKLKELCDDDALRVIDALAHVKALDGIPEALQEVIDSGGSNSVVTSSSLLRVVPGLVNNDILKHFGEPGNERVWSAVETLIADLRYGRAIPKSSTTPEIYEYALDATKATEGNVVAVEDSASGLGAALAAGIPTIGLIAASHIPVEERAAHEDKLYAKAVEVLGRPPTNSELIIVEHPSQIVPAIAKILGREPISSEVPELNCF